MTDKLSPSKMWLEWCPVPDHQERRDLNPLRPGGNTVVFPRLVVETMGKLIGSEEGVIHEVDHVKPVHTYLYLYEVVHPEEVHSGKIRLQSWDRIEFPPEERLIRYDCYCAWHEPSRTLVWDCTRCAEPKFFDFLMNLRPKTQKGPDAEQQGIEAHR